MADGAVQPRVSFSSLPAAGSGLQDWVELTGSVGGVNVMAAAIAVSVVARFGLRVGLRWAWWFLLFCLLWVGLHDAVAATRFFAATGQPVMLMPYTYCALMAAGLLKSRRAVFAAPTPPDERVARRGPQAPPATEMGAAVSSDSARFTPPRFRLKTSTRQQHSDGMVQE